MGIVPHARPFRLVCPRDTDMQEQALGHAVTRDQIKRGDLVLLEAMGGGFTWGSVLIRW